MERAAVGPVISRRALFGGAASIAVPVYLGSGPTRRLMAGASRPQGDRTLSLAAFTAVVGTRFRVRTGSFRFVDLTLVEVDAHPEHARGVPVRGESFSLIFAGDPIAAGTHRVGHPAFGWFPLSMAPVGMALQGQRYEAVVNRRVPASRSS